MIPSYLAWRIVTAFAAVVAAISLALGPYLYKLTTDNADANSRLVCSMADLLGRAPLTPIPGQSREDFLDRLDSFRDFSRALQSSGADCSPRIERRLEDKIAEAKDLIQQQRGGVDARNPGPGPGGRPGPPPGGPPDDEPPLGDKPPPDDDPPPNDDPRPEPPPERDCTLKVNELVCVDIGLPLP